MAATSAFTASWGSATLFASSASSSGEVARVLGKDLPYEQVTVTTFLELIGQPDDRAKLKHFEAVTIDQQEGLLAGVDDAARTIVGQPLVTVEEFNDQRSSEGVYSEFCS